MTRISALALLFASVAMAGAPSVGADPRHSGDTAFERLAEELTIAASVPAPACGAHGDDCASAKPSGSEATGSASLDEVGRVATTRWFPETRARADESFIRVHGYGDVAAVAPDGRILWRRPSPSFYPDWGITPYLVPTVAIGSSPLNPNVLASDDAWSIGDVTGDGTEDVAVSHRVVTREIGPEEETFEYIRSFVTLLDGRDGATLWHREFPKNVSQAVLAGEVLLVGNETGDRTGTSTVIGEDGSRTSVHAFRISPAPDGVEVGPAWTFDTGVQHERILAIERVGEGSVAVARPSGVHAFDLATGEPAWTVPISGVPRLLRYDAARELLVVQELRASAGLAVAPSYALLGLTAADGQRSVEIVRADATLLSLDVADVAGGPEPEWIVGDLALGRPGNLLTSTNPVARVAAIDPAASQPLWTHEHRSGEDIVAARSMGISVPLFYGVEGVGGSVVAAWFGPGGTTSGLTGLDGATGAERWEEFGPDVVFPVFLERSRIDGAAVVLSSTPHQRVRAHDPRTGEVVAYAPALAGVLSVVDVDVDGDGVDDVVAGNESGGVFALDGTDLDRILWQASATGPVHQLELSDLDGDGEPEIVAAAHRGVDVLHLDGSSMFTVDRPAPDLVWTITLSDLDGDGLDDIVVPTRSLSAWRGTDGAMLWEFLPPAHDEGLETRFSTSVVTGGRVLSQFVNREVTPGTDLHGWTTRYVVGLDGASGERDWLRVDGDPVDYGLLWRSMTLVPGEGPAGTAVGVSWHEQDGVTGDWTIAAEVLDPATGDVVRSAVLESGSNHRGTLFLEPYGLMTLSGEGIARLAPDGVTETSFGHIVSDVAVVQTVGGPKMLNARSRVEVHDAGVGFQGGVAGEPEASWSELRVGGLHVADLDRDGTQEVVAFPFDEATFFEISASWEGTQHLSLPDFRFQGLVVLEVR